MGRTVAYLTVFQAPAATCCWCTAGCRPGLNALQAGLARFGLPMDTISITKAVQHGFRHPFNRT